MGEPGKAFFDRTEETGLIEDTLVSIREGNPANLCISGIPGSGKSSLLLEYVARRVRGWHDEGVILCHVPFGQFADAAADLARGLVSKVCASFLTAVGAAEEARRICNEDTFPDEARRMRSLAVEAFLDVFERFSHPKAPGEEDVLKAAAAFPEEFAREKGLRYILFADDFHVLQGVKAGRNGQAVDLFRTAIDGQADVFWIVTVVPCLFTDKYFNREDGPFHGSFQFFPLEGLPPEAALEMAVSILDEDCPAAPRIAGISAGVPLYISALAQASRKAAGNETPGESHADRAFVSQVLAPFGVVNRHFEALLNAPSSSREDVKATRSILSLLAAGKRLGRDELARTSDRDGRELASMLGRILTSGLFRRVGSSYYFDDPVFRFWAKKTADPAASTGAFERLSSTDSKRIVEEFFSGMAEEPIAQTPQIDEQPEGRPGQRPQASPAPSKFNFRQLVARMKGRTVGGSLMGSGEAVEIPGFERVQGFAFTSKDIKVYYLSGEEQGWVMLVVWRQQQLGPEFVELLARRASGKVNGAWLISRGGFTAEAEKAARDLGVFVSSERDLRDLMEG